VHNYGILSTDILPTRNALIPCFALYDKFPDRSFNPDKALYWLLLATREGRFGGASSTAIDGDLKAIDPARTFKVAIKALLNNLDEDNDIITTEDLSEKYTDGFLRLLFYLLAFKNEAKDWMTGIRLGYDNVESKLINSGFEPEWHHLFPRSYIRKVGKNILQEEINSFANIVVLAQKANRTISSKSPKDYIKELEITDQMLKQQVVPTNFLYRTAPHFRTFLKVRSKKLSRAMTQYFQELNR
jgi:hypothetical protein